MEGFDDAGVFYSDDLRDLQHDGQSQTRQALKQKLKEFLRQFHDGNFHYKYRYVHIPGTPLFLFLYTPFENIINTGFHAGIR